MINKGTMMKLHTTTLVLACALAGCGKAPPPEPTNAAPAANGAAAAADREPDENMEKDPLLSEAKVAHSEVAEAFVTAATPQDNLDSPAAWAAPDGKRWVITTAKKSGELVVFDGDSGERLRTVGGKGSAPGQMDRPNGVAVVGDLVLVVERDNHRVQAFSLPDFTSVAVFGGDDLKKPYGLWAHAKDGGIEVIVSDNYMLGADEETVPALAELGQRFRRYQLVRDGAAWKASLQQTFGDTSEAGAIRIAESVYADPDNNRLLLAEEDVPTGTRLREYTLADGKYAGRDIGADQFKAQAEGIALLACKDGSGYWIGTDQFKDRSVFHVFDRRTLEHVGAFAGKLTANTDGVWMDARGNARFPQGVFYALHDDQAVAAFDWRDVASALKLKACAQ
ncbi:phytase [Stenotrophomonas sp. Marseille-Q4652]|uniref:phytase n=1 Tax=Stenotrophomonas sp. Marseille-Q4652 TaxID=2866595 RepID=UPI001CE472AD|nr:phytase [Stenotrophomonas sp. Marseille-Q4652]